MSYCSFERKVIDGAPHAVCSKCGRPYPTEDADPSRHVRRCTAEGWTPSPLAKIPCSHRGEKAGGIRVACCGGQVNVVPIWGCSLHSTCTEQPQAADVAGVVHRTCEGCADYA